MTTMQVLARDLLHYAEGPRDAKPLAYRNILRKVEYDRDARRQAMVKETLRAIVAGFDHKDRASHWVQVKYQADIMDWLYVRTAYFERYLEETPAPHIITDFHSFQRMILDAMEAEFGEIMRLLIAGLDVVQYLHVLKEEAPPTK